MSVSSLRDPGAGKGPDAFRTISEVAEDLDLPQHVLRFWETRFNQIKPMKRGGGRRYYRPEDVDLLRGIRLLLYGEGFTIRGVQRLLKEKGSAFVVSAGQSGSVETVTPSDMDPSGGAVSGFPAAGRKQAAASRAAGLRTADTMPEGRLAPPAAEPGAQLETASEPVLPGQARARLVSALSELQEAKRLLDQAR